MVRSGLFVTLTAVTLAVVAGCGSKPALTAADARSGTASAGSFVTLPQFRNGDTFAYVLGTRLGALGTPTDEYLTIQVNRSAAGDLTLHYTSTHVHSRRRTRTERQFGIRAEKSLRVRTASHRYSQDAGGTLRWNGPVDSGYLTTPLVECSFLPEIRSPFTVGAVYDSGPTTFHSPHTGSSTTTGRVRYQVVGVEEVRVPAGTFQACRVEFEVTRDGAEGPGATHRWTDWYHGERWLVKREETSPGLKILGRETQITTTMELLVQPPTFPDSWKRDSP